jgi:hypothetical protein
LASLILIGITLLNLGISWWNCKVVGSIWRETKEFGGFMRVLAWCGAIQAAVGFSSVLILVGVFTSYATGFLPKEYAEAAVSLWYLLIIVPALGTGLVITVHSLIEAWRERNMAAIGTAAWNLFATGTNFYSAASNVPDSFGKVSNLFGGDKDDQKVAFVLLLVTVAIAGGALITWLLISHYAKQARLSPIPQAAHA